MKKLINFYFLITISILLSRNIFAKADVDAELISALQNASVPVSAVVTFYGEGAPSESQIGILNQAGITKGFSFQSLPIAGVLITLQQVESLTSNPEVRSIYLNKQLEFNNYNGTALTGVDRLRSDQTITSQNGGMPVSGKGIGILVNDSGIDGTHADVEFGSNLVQNVLGSTNPHAYDELLPIVYLENVPSTDNNSGHGTHVAGTVGGTGVRSSGKYEGVAPGANLIGSGSGAVLLVLDAIGGFDYALTHQFEYGIKVITNSWGSSGSFSPDNPVNVASKKAYDRGIVVTFSAGNSGPGEGTLTPYAAPWVITVAAGDKFGSLADFSSRGIKDESYNFTLNGQTWTYENKPTITAPGVDVISTRALGPLPLLGDDSGIETQYVPFYTTMSGTSMACPHVAGIVALILEVNSSLSPSQIKDIIQQTATNMPGFEPWEVGAGYVNAYAAVDYALRSPGYGSTVNMSNNFNSNLNVDITRLPFEIDYNPVPALSDTENRFLFTLPEGVTGIEIRADAHGPAGEEGNTINLVLISPDGTEYSSGVYAAFTLYHDRTVAVANPIPGEWVVELRGLKGDPLNPTDGAALPEVVSGKVKLVNVLGYTGLNDIAGHPAESSIKLAINSRLADGFSNGSFKPDQYLTRYQLASYLIMGQAIRQNLPTNGMNTFTDIGPNQKLIAESSTAFGSALRDRFHEYRGVILPAAEGKFSPDKKVNRVDITYSMVQSLGLETEALALNGRQVTVNFNGQNLPIEDAYKIPSGFEGYVQLALNMNLINAYYKLEQRLFQDPIIHATFSPLANITRGEFAVIATRTHNQWTEQALGKKNSTEEINAVPYEYSLEQNYPNPFNPSTTLKFSLPEDNVVSIEIFNTIGEKVFTLLNEYRQAGSYKINFNADNLSSGIYFSRIKAGSFIKTIKMNLLK